MVSTVRARLRTVALPAASVAVTVAATRPSGRRATAFQAPVASAVAETVALPAAIATSAPGSAVPAKVVALRGLRVPGAGVARATFGAFVSTSKSQLRVTERAKTLLVEKLTSTECVPSLRRLAGFRATCSPDPRTREVTSVPSRLTLRSPRRSDAGTVNVICGRASETAAPGPGSGSPPTAAR